MSTGEARRTAVTGIGVVAPGGVTRVAFWETITAGRTATRRITFFDASGFRSQSAAEADFDARAAGLSEQEIARMDRYIQFAVAAGMEAVTDSALDLEAVEPEQLRHGALRGGQEVAGGERLRRRGREAIEDRERDGVEAARGERARRAAAPRSPPSA